MPNKIIYIVGDATEPIGDGQKMIIHCCNTIGAWGAGFVLAISKKWNQPKQIYKQWHKNNGLKLGTVQFVQVEDSITVVNMIGQEGIRGMGNYPPIRYSAIAKCLLQVSDFAKLYNASIHCPRFGAGLAGGEWSIIEKMLDSTLIERGIDVTVYDFPGV